MVQRLKDQRAVFLHAQAIHENPRLLDERAFYPEHDKRLETPEYHKAHDHLTKTLDLPCLVCGVKQSTLHDKTQNRYGAKQMETHHHIIEWALANAIDADKFNKVLLPHLKVRHPQNPAYKKDAFTDADVSAWVDHSEDNLWVLCDVHHRAKYLGIHEISYPIWCPMDLLRPDFEEYVRRQVQENKPVKKKAAKTKNAKKRKARKKKA
ncbi:MAG TPA: hypothetical protein VNH64_07690 [Parvularculaceae bacterium]|nr:hypothetical protein [Parvularculaceae bacterium]